MKCQVHERKRIHHRLVETKEKQQPNAFWNLDLTLHQKGRISKEKNGFHILRKTI